MTLRRWTEPFAETAPADVVVEAFGCGLPASYVAAMARSRRRARVVHPRILERGAVGRRRARAGVAPSAAPAAAAFLVSRASRPGPAACSASAASLAARDAFRRDDAAQRRYGPRSEFRRRRRAKSASRSSAIRIRRCRRCSMRGPTATTRSCASCPTVLRPARSTCGPRATCRIRATRSIAAA